MILQVLPGLTIFEAFEIKVLVKQWAILIRRCFDISELLVGLLCSFHLTSALRIFPTWFVWLKSFSQSEKVFLLTRFSKTITSVFNNNS